MREAPAREREMGMAWYVSDADGTGGRLRTTVEDFVVREREQFDVAIQPVDADHGAYPHLVFRATLFEWDTNDFADALAGKLGTSRELVNWAGTKDKRAVTTQLFAVKTEANDLPELRDAEIEILGRAGRPVLFGDLAGNAFELRVREVEAPENAEAITRALRTFATGDESNSDRPAPDGGGPAGVPNYFGHQRFGSRRPVTHRVGLAVVRGDWEEAVMTYLTMTDEEEPADTREARAFVAEARDWSAALDRLPRKLRYERSMLHVLADRAGDGEPTTADWQAALEALPTNLQSLLVNAAQSYAFNHVLSERLEQGLPFHEAVAGDVVCFADRDAPEGLALPDVGRLQPVDADRVRTVNRHCARGRAFVTAPLVGTETEFADGEPGEITREVFADLGIERADFDLPGEFHSTGTRRAVLLRTDLAVERIADDVVDSDGEDLRFEFALPKGSYATVLLREYLKDDPGALA